MSFIRLKQKQREASAHTIPNHMPGAIAFHQSIWLEADSYSY